MLTPKKKFNKKELKHDPLLDTLEKGKEFYEENSKQIISAIVAVAIILLLGWGWMNSIQTENSEAMLANTKATLAAAAGMNDNVIAELGDVVDAFGTNENISLSVFQLGVAKMSAGDYSGAREHFTQLSKSSDHYLKIAGKLKLAYLSERESDYSNAAALYNEVAGMSDELASDYAKLQAAYAFLAAGNVPQAENIVADLLRADPTGNFKESVKYLEGKVLEK